MTPQCVRLFLSTVLLGLGTLQAQSTTVTVPAATVNKQTAIAVAQFNMNTTQNYAALATMAYVNSTCQYGNNVACPSFPDATAAINFLNDKYRVFSGNQPPPTLIAGLTKEEIIKFTVERGVKALAAVEPETAPWGEFAVAGLDLYQKAAARQLDQEHQDKALFQSYDNYTKGTDSGYATSTMSQYIDNLNTNPTLKQANDIVFASSVWGGQIDLSAQQRIQNSPAFATFAAVPQILQVLQQSNGDFRALLTDTNNLITTNFQAVLSDLGDVRNTLSTVVQNQTSILGYIANQQAQQALQARTEQELQVKQLRLEAASSSVYLLSSFIGFVDPHFAKEVSIAGNAVINVASSIAKFNDFAAHLTGGSSNGSINEATALGSLVLAGNMFSTGMQIVSLFSDSGPSPDQLILNQLQQISQQIIALHQDMDARFNQVDQSLTDIKVNLSQIYNGLTDQLTSIANGIDHLNDKVEVIESQLSGLESDISRMEHDIHSNELDIYRQPLLLAIDSGIAYKERTGVDLLYDGNAPTDYTSLESTLHTWATQLSAQGIDAPMPSVNDPNFNDNQLMNTFSVASLAVNVNYLNLLPQVKFNLPQLLNGVQLTNLDDWAKSAQAYVELAREWPVYDREFPAATTRLAQVRAVGANLQSAIKAVTVNPNGSPNSALFSALQGFYSTKSANFMAALDTYERQFEVTPGAMGFDLWAGGAQQTVPAHVPTLPPNNAMSYLNFDYNYARALSPPAGYVQFVPNSALNADNLKINTFKLSWTDNITDQYFQKDPDGAIHQHSWISVTGGFLVPNGNGRYYPIFFRTIRGPDLCFFGHCSGTFDQQVYAPVKTLWDSGLNGQFLSQSVPGYGQDFFSHISDPTLKQIFQTSEAQILAQCSQNTTYFEFLTNQALTQRQPAFYAKLLADLGTREPLLTPVLELSGASSVLSAMATFGLQRSLDSDELLRTLLFGQERVPDATILAQLLSGYSSSLTDPKSVNGTLSSRLTAAFNEVSNVLAQIANGSRLESSRAVDNILDSIDRHTAVRLLPFATDVTGAVLITKGGFRYNNRTKSFVQTVSIKNVGGSTISGPLTLVLDLLRSGSGQSDTVLTNANGQIVVMAPLGSSYINVNLGLSSALPAGASVAVPLNFSSPSQSGILYQTRVLAGNGFR